MSLFFSLFFPTVLRAFRIFVLLKLKFYRPELLGRTRLVHPLKPCQGLSKTAETKLGHLLGREWSSFQYGGRASSEHSAMEYFRRPKHNVFLSILQGLNQAVQIPPPAHHACLVFKLFLEWKKNYTAQTKKKLNDGGVDEGGPADICF